MTGRNRKRDLFSTSPRHTQRLVKRNSIKFRNFFSHGSKSRPNTGSYQPVPKISDQYQGPIYPQILSRYHEFIALTEISEDKFKISSEKVKTLILSSFPILSLIFLLSPHLLSSPYSSPHLQQLSNFSKTHFIQGFGKKKST